MKYQTKYSILIAFLMLFAFAQLSAQAIVLNAPEPADNPNLSGNSPWTAICAGNGGFNEYFVNITWAGTANAGNEFILELSDAAGDFSNPVNLVTVTDQNSNNDFDVSFSVPTDTRGQGYKMRVRSTDPVREGAESPAYNMYYMDVTGNLNISQLGDGVPPGSICSVNPITLQVDNISNPETYQYLWFRSGTLLSGENGHTLNVTETGIYNVFVDYGPVCTGSGNTDSNAVDVTIGSGGNNIAISPPSKTALCSSDTEVLVADQTDNSWNYQWFKNGEAILGAVAPTYTVNGSTVDFEGDYALEISGASICNELSDPVTITDAENFTVEVDNDLNVVLLPSIDQTLSITTNADTPSYKWFRDTVELAGETNNTLVVSQPGQYYAEISQTGGDCGLITKNSEVTVVESPASFDIIINYTEEYTACVNTSIDLEVVRIDAIADDGSISDVTSQLRSAFSYQWVKDGSDLTGAMNQNLSISSNTDNGSYVLNASLETYNESSNALAVQLLTNEILNITSTGTVYCSPEDAITMTTGTDLSSATFQWLLNGANINSTDQTLNVSATGTYQLVLDRDGCSLSSNEIIIATLDESLITLSEDDQVFLPEGNSLNVIASGGDSYVWFDSSNNELSTTDSVSVTNEDVYTVVASVGNCDVIRQIEVVFLDTFKVPNVISVNGDGINDQWIIPNKYSNQEDVNVIIYNSLGEEILNEFDYRNNWPQTATSFTKQNMVFYYKIRNANEVLKQGTITVIR